MLIIISELHLTEGNSAETIRAGAFRAFRESLCELAYDASWRSDKKYVPVDRIEVVLLGDILDVIRSTRWCDAPAEVRPWGNQSLPAFSETVQRITEDVIEKNKESLDILRSLHNPEIMSVLPASLDAGSQSGRSKRARFLCPTGAEKLTLARHSYSKSERNPKTPKAWI